MFTLLNVKSFCILSICCPILHLICLRSHPLLYFIAQYDTYFDLISHIFGSLFYEFCSSLPEISFLKDNLAPILSKFESYIINDTIDTYLCQINDRDFGFSGAMRLSDYIKNLVHSPQQSYI